MSEVNESVNENLKDKDIEDFVKENCILDKDKRVRGTDIHERYVEYCETKGVKPLELIYFYKELDKVCGRQIVKSRWFEGKKRIRGFDGIDIK